MLVLVVAVFFLVVAVVVYLPFRTMRRHDKKMSDIKSELHKYSGLNPNLYFECISDLEAVEKNLYDNIELSADKLYVAIDKANALASYSTGVHTYVIDEIRDITERIGFRGEELIFERALISGYDFRPIYLNELH